MDRSCLNRSLILLLVAAFVLTAAPNLTREGEYWVLTQTGALPLRPQGSLKVTGNGIIRLQGGTIEASGYTLKKKVRARSEASARRLLEAFHVQSFPAGQSIQLLMRHRNAAEVLAEMEIHCRSDLREVSLDTDGGDLEVYDVEGRVVARSGGGYIQMDRIGGNVSARTAGGEIRLGRVDGSARSYSGGGSIKVGHVSEESFLETAGGEIYVHESIGPVQASTAGGNILIEKAAAAVSARTAGGRIDIQQAAGLVFAGNTGGSIQVGGAHGVRCESAGGSIKLRNSSGALRASTDVGSIFAELVSGVSMADSWLSSAAGDITVSIPASLALTIKASNQSPRGGRIVSEFSEIPVRQLRNAALRGSSAEGILNGGGPVLQISSTTGTIYLRRTQP